jgi:hypothetical protein
MDIKRPGKKRLVEEAVKEKSESPEVRKRAIRQMGQKRLTKRGQMVKKRGIKRLKSKRWDKVRKPEIGGIVPFSGSRTGINLLL